MSDSFDYEQERQRVKSVLESGKFDVEVLENEGIEDFTQDDVNAFEKHLDSEESKSLSAEIFGK